MQTVASQTSGTPASRKVRLGPREVLVDRRADGVVYLRSPHQLGHYPAKMTERLDYWADQAPTRIFLAERDSSGGWRKLTYAQTRDAVRRIGEALIHRRLSPERPIVILSGNDIEHALLGLAANYIGVPYAPISPGYSLMSRDFGRLRYIIDLLTPGLVFAADGDKFFRSIEAVISPDVETVVTRNPIVGRKTTLFEQLQATQASSAVDLAHAQVSPDTIAKFLFTSGSTAAPKAVINTQRMWCSNQEMIRNVFAYFQDEPPILIDWAPWHHTGGGNHDFGIALYNGGSFYIDDGKPTPEAIELSVRNLREVSPTWYFNVPKGFETLLPYLRADSQLREVFFRQLKVLFYAGAGMPQHVYEEIETLAVATCGERISFLTSLGATETAPLSIARTWESDKAGNVGLPAPGIELKLVPLGGKLEACIRGPNVMPGYWRAPELTARAFDAEGFYRMGDAVRFADPDEPAMGLLFDGRLGEDFKLTTGTWVNVGPLRVKIIEHFAPYVRDVVIVGRDRDSIAALIFPNFSACHHLAPDRSSDAAPATLIADPRLRAEFADRLQTLSQQSTGSSNHVSRILLLEEPPSIDLGEITDKGAVSQKVVLNHRAALVEELYTASPSSRVIVATAHARPPQQMTGQ